MAANNNFLPKSMCTLNKHGVASRVLLMQAIIVTLLCSGFLLLPSVNAIYWLFTDLSTELYMMMYVLMFLAAWQLKRTLPNVKGAFSIPGGKPGYYLICISGLIGCSITLLVGFIPPEQAIDIGGADHFRKIFSLGIILMLIPAFILYLRKRMSTKN